MNKSLKDAELLRKYSSRMGGTFSTVDLRNLFGEQNQIMLHRRICTLAEAGILTRFCRGIYVLDGFSPEVLASRTIEESYLSLGTVLAKEMMIGSVPARTIYAVRVGKNRIFRGAQLTIEYVGIKESLFFGYKPVSGIRYATAEKAFLDTLYFHLRGRAYSFDIYQDIDTTRLDRGLIGQWLIKYRNPRFVSFVKGYLDDRH
jgi:predicted transcriptional regulator of viral defense system